MERKWGEEPLVPLPQRQRQRKRWSWLLLMLLLLLPRGLPDPTDFGEPVEALPNLRWSPLQ